MGENALILIIFSVIIILISGVTVIFALWLGKCCESKRFEGMPEWEYLLGLGLILVICGVIILFVGKNEMKKEKCPGALDVYRGKTKIRIETVVIDGTVAKADSTVLWKDAYHD